MKTIVIAICPSIFALAALPASGQDYAPASIPVSSSVSWESTVTEDYGSGPEAPYFEAYSLLFTSANTFSVAPDTTGTCAYTKTGPNTATLTYTANTVYGFGTTETEQGTLLLTFTSATNGTFTNSGSFVYNYEGGSDGGTFTSIGTFTYSPTLVFALPPVSDDFNDNTKDTAKWGDDIEYTPGGTLTESSQRLNYSSNSPEGTQARPWILNPPRYDQDWEVVVDLAGTFGSGGQGAFPQAGMGIDISTPGNQVDFMGCQFNGYDNGTSIDWEVYGGMSGGGGVGPIIPLASGQTCLRVSFDSSTKVLTCYYDPDGPQNGYTWLQLASLGINGSGGEDGNSSWGLSGSQPFQISLFGYSSDRTIPSGSLYADNFRISAIDVFAPEITVNIPSAPALVDGSSMVDFQSTTAGSPFTKTFTIRNDGNAPLTGLALSKVGTNAANFTLGTLGATSLDPGASTTFDVTCTPQAGAAQTATLRIASNDSNENPFDIPLTARLVAITGDDFNDNSKNTAKWDTDLVFSTGGTLAETNLRLEYTSNTSSGDHGIYRPWILNQATYDKDWELIMDVGNSLSFGSGEHDTGIGIEIFPPGTFDKSFFTEMNSSSFLPSDIFHGFVSGQGEDEFGNLDQKFPSPGVSGSIRIVYDSATKVFTTYCDTDGSANGFIWRPLATFGITGSGGAVNASWNMSGAQVFQVAVYGFVDRSIVTSGQMTADNFSIITAASGTAVSPVQSWQVAKFGSASAPEAALDFDADKDGLLNLLEFAFKLEPQVPGTPVLTTVTGTSGLPRITPTGTGPTQRLRLEYVRQKASSNPGITYVPQFSSTLQGGGTGGWSAITGPETVVSIDTEWERVVVEDTAGTGLQNRFGRVVVSAP